LNNFFVVGGLEIRAYTLSHSTSPFFVMGFFKIGSHKLLARTLKHDPPCWVWEPKGQINEYSIPHGEHYEPCTLRRSYKSAFLHPEEETQGLINLTQG
jgi:hypothetical protein